MYTLLSNNHHIVLMRLLSLLEQRVDTSAYGLTGKWPLLASNEGALCLAGLPGDVSRPAHFTIRQPFLLRKF